MTVLFDINHPAHVHYFRNSIILLKKKGFNVLVVSRNKEIEHELLREYDLDFYSRGRGVDNIFGKALYHFFAVCYLVSKIFVNKVDLVVSFMHPYAAQAAWLTNTKSLVFSDTEIASLHHKLTIPFATEVHTPFTFKKELGKSHIRFTGFMESAYLHLNHFEPDKSILKTLGVDCKEPYILFRFVSRKSLHDRGHIGVTHKQKIELVEKLAKKYKVFISSELELPQKLQKYNLEIEKKDIHQAIYFAKLVIGESATMTAESALLGTPAVYIDNEGRGYTDYLAEEYDIVYRISESKMGVDSAIVKAEEIMAGDVDYKVVREKVLSESIDTSNYIYEQIIRINEL